MSGDSSGWQGLEGGDGNGSDGDGFGTGSGDQNGQGGANASNPNCGKSFDLRFLVDTSTSMNCSNERGEVESTYCEGGAGSRIELAKKLMKDIRDSFSENTK